MSTVVHVVGARPNFMKIAPVIDGLRPHASIVQRLVHTGQHYDERMAQVFFEDLGLPRPDRDLEVSSGSQAEQTGAVMVAFERVIDQERPDLVVVVGDVNSTLAATLVSVKAGVPVAHVEAGLRSFDMSMPEEINRLVTDRLSTIFLTPSADANDNLRREGVPEDRIFEVGNVMIDTLVRHRTRAPWAEVSARFGLRDREYAVLTPHRPANVDAPEHLRDNTERPVTIEQGTNTLVGADGRGLAEAFDGFLATGGKRGRAPAGWDGHAGERTGAILAAFLGRA